MTPWSPTFPVLPLIQDMSTDGCCRPLAPMARRFLHGTQPRAARCGAHSCSSTRRGTPWQAVCPLRRGRPQGLSPAHMCHDAREKASPPLSALCPSGGLTTDKDASVCLSACISTSPLGLPHCWLADKRLPLSPPFSSCSVWPFPLFRPPGSFFARRANQTAARPSPLHLEPSRLHSCMRAGRRDGYLIVGKQRAGLGWPRRLACSGGLLPSRGEAPPDWQWPLRPAREGGAHMAVKRPQHTSESAFSIWLVPLPRRGTRGEAVPVCGLGDLGCFWSSG